MSGSALSFSGVAQQPREAIQAGSTTSAPYEVTITPATVGAWIIEGITGGQPRTSTPTGTGQVERTDNPQGNVSDGAVAATSTTLVTAAVPTTVGWTFDGSMNRTAQVASSWERAAAKSDAYHSHTVDHVLLTTAAMVVEDVSHAHTVEHVTLVDMSPSMLLAGQVGGAALIGQVHTPRPVLIGEVDETTIKGTVT